MQVNLIKENEDGSADFSFELNEEEKAAFIRLGILSALESAVKDSAKLVPESTANEHQTTA